MPTISVVIPYFQREAGVLGRALASVAAQRDCPLPVEIIVVDDESPVPATAEVKSVALPPGMTLSVLYQTNGGPGAARNTGLSAVRPDTRYVAFLDSDDEWSPQHLWRAVTALDAGYDFFFADLLQLDQSVGAFARAGRITPAEHPRLAGAPGLHAYKGDMFHQILTGNVVGTPTVVYRWQGFEARRFRAEFRSMGEDYLFWMELVTHGAKVAFSSEVGAVCGRGVNIFAGAGWGTPGYLRRVHDSMRFRHTVGKLFKLNPEQAAHVDESFRSLRREFQMGLMHHLLHRLPLQPSVLTAQARLDPLSLLLLPWAVLRKVVGR